MTHIVITGSTRGIGLGLAKEFLKRGCKVTINGTSDASVASALDELLHTFPKDNFLGMSANVSVQSDIEILWDIAVTHFGAIDIWINNAGIDQKREMVWNLSQDDYQTVIQTNVIGVMNGSSVAFRNMLSQGYGQIYNMEGFGSNGMIRKKMAIYGTSKTAVSYFTKSLALEAKKTNIKVSTISPGMVATDFLKNLFEKDQNAAEETKKVFNILADKVETVTPFLATKILENDQNGAKIQWLTKPKIILRFLSSAFIKRDVF